VSRFLFIPPGWEVVQLVGLQTLNLAILVRVQASQPILDAKRFKQIITAPRILNISDHCSKKRLHYLIHSAGLRQLMTEYPKFDLTGLVAVVTGAARGLGRAISLALAHAGADVALGFRDKAGGVALAAQIESMGRRALPLQMDVMRLDEIFRAMEQTESFFGKIDILVNNAGGGFTNLAADVSESEFDATLTLNVKSTFFASQAAAKIMARHGGGKIINMSSQAAFAALPSESVYCASKAAISQLTKCLAVEWGPRNITVNAVAPTFIATPGTEEQLSDPAFRADVIERIAGLHRIGEPMDVAGAVIFLASPAASLITGHTMLIDGGWTSR
jgi:NAD(P)-dependent dehydrogenase (short-subunit alcohol dehydrogenase family)